jgi:hypothetical protein
VTEIDRSTPDKPTAEPSPRSNADLALGGPEGPTGRSWANEPARGLLRDELRRRSAELADIYWGAISVLDVHDNPERLAMSGHSLRELQDRLPRILAVPEASERMKLEDVFPGVADKWESMRDGTDRRTDAGDWQGEIDTRLRRFLQWFDAFVRKFRERNVRMERVSRATLGRLDPGLESVPAETGDEAVRIWLAVRRTFVGFAHHNLVEETVLFDALVRFESLLGDRLYPKTFEKQAQIDSIIREAEVDAADR